MLAPDTHLGPYRLIARIGAGGMGEVWKGEDTRLGRTVAIKVLPPSVAADHEATARLRREARTAAQLYHPNIAMIHAIEQDGDRIFIVMEFVEGEPLSKIIKRGALSEAELCRIGRGVAEALAEAHAKGIVHRDIKPDNVIVNGQRVKVLDFGIAKQVDAPAPVSQDAPTAFVTQQGMIVGTVHYMSPEQALGKNLDARTDIFSLGVVLYEGATGRMPFTGETATETMMHIIRDEAPDPAKFNAAITPGMKAIIDKCLRKNREERFASAADLAAALEQQLGHASTDPYTAAVTQLRAAPPTVIERAPAPRKPGRWLWLTLGAIVLAAGIIGAIATRPPAKVAAPKPAPPPPVAATTATTAVTVTAPPTPQIVETKTTAPEPPPRREEPALAAAPPPAPTPAPATPDAHEHYRRGQDALFARDFERARAEYEAAWLDKEHLDARERHFVRLGMAAVNHNRFEGRKIVMEIERHWPGDPDLERFKREFGEEPPPMQGRPLRPRWRKP